MAQYTYKCPCGASATSEERSAVGRIMTDTGMTAVLTHHGGLIWMCETCHAKACLLAQQLVAVCGGDKDVYLPNFVREQG